MFWELITKRLKHIQKYVYCSYKYRQPYLVCWPYQLLHLQIGNEFNVAGSDVQKHRKIRKLPCPNLRGCCWTSFIIFVRTSEAEFKLTVFGRLFNKRHCSKRWRIPFTSKRNYYERTHMGIKMIVNAHKWSVYVVSAAYVQRTFWASL